MCIYVCTTAARERDRDGVRIEEWEKEKRMLLMMWSLNLEIWKRPKKFSSVTPRCRFFGGPSVSLSPSLLKEKSWMSKTVLMGIGAAEIKHVI